MLRGFEENEHNLYSDMQDSPRVRRPKAVRVNPGTVVVAGAPVENESGKVINENPNSYYVLNDDPG